MPTFRDNYALGVDLSSYQPDVDWQTLKAGNVSFAFARACYYDRAFVQDASFASHVQGAHDAGLPMIAYHVLNPGYYAYKLGELGKLQDLDRWLPPDQDEQFSALVAALKNKTYHALAIDFEISTDWAGKLMPELWLFEAWRQFALRLRGHFAGKPVVTYTANWFVSRYCLPVMNVGLKETVENLRVDATALWVAHYPYNKTTVSMGDWAGLPAHYPPNDMVIDGRTTQNPPFLGWDNWTFWQFSGDKFKLPGVYGAAGAPSAVDLNFYNGTREKLYTWLGFRATEDAQPEPTPVPAPQPTPEPGNSDLAAIAADVKSVKQMLERIFK